ncbi:hypothetical protein [Thiocapsa bogorovii]|uniref:hypothetical protein n=1 Tax=Thiocapsa bogorovii TaxID=521689 RepID=UPI001E40A449|nr:hypothetical protein [Thiocapsa bogorovii]UHD17519.1 hypothetical protein LT988_05565 [Thiocapsa bogorovii]
MFSVDHPEQMIRFGFKFGKGGAHAARTMMLSELQRLLEVAKDEWVRDDYRTAVVEENVLDKPTLNARKFTFRHLRNLYILDPGTCLFRIFRELWAQDRDGQPVFALQMALTRDALLRDSVSSVLATPEGQRFEREAIERLLSESDEGRFTAASLKSFAQNINGTWTRAGYLTGHVNKTRSHPVITPANVTFALFLGYLEGRLARRLFTSDWVRVLDLPEERLIELTQAAAQRGLLVFRRTGSVMEVRFPDYLTEQEQEWLSEQA